MFPRPTENADVVMMNDSLLLQELFDIKLVLRYESLLIEIIMYLS